MAPTVGLRAKHMVSIGKWGTENTHISKRRHHRLLQMVRRKMLPQNVKLLEVTAAQRKKSFYHIGRVQTSQIPATRHRLLVPRSVLLTERHQTKRTWSHHGNGTGEKQSTQTNKTKGVETHHVVRRLVCLPKGCASG